LRLAEILMAAKKAAKAKPRKPAARKPAPAKAAASRKAKIHAKPKAPAVTTPPRKPVPAATAKKAAKSGHAAETASSPSRPIVAKPPPPTFVDRMTPRAVNAADAEDSDDALSLLSGPRNVQPYIARRGEQYMNKEQLEHFRMILNTWKRDLMVEVDRTVLHMKDEAANFPDPNDRATQESEFSLELRTRDRERKLIRKIDEALKRIEDGSYGYCLETGEEIGIKRLEARPVATLSLEAQERRERREKQYGDRDDRHR
jgi:DnaK suppressor protein